MSHPMTRIEEIKQRMEKATPGPWAGEDAGDETYIVFTHIDPAKVGGVTNAIHTLFESDWGTEEDTALIANAPSDLAYLLSELEEANKSKWISVEDRLPANQRAVLIAYTDRGKESVTMGWYCPAKTCNADDFSDEVEGEYYESTDTFWMKEGWVDESRESEYHYPILGVTHWQPIRGTLFLSCMGIRIVIAT